MPDGRNTFPQRRPTQCDRILAILNDREQHTAAELYRTGCVLHSRISDLRKRGYTIDLERVYGVGAEAFLYRLIGTPGERESTCATGLSAASSLAPGAPVQETSPGSWLTGGTADGAGAPVLHPGQLTIEAAA